MLKSLFPSQIDNRFDDYRAALWLLGLFVALILGLVPSLMPA